MTAEGSTPSMKGPADIPTPGPLAERLSRLLKKHAVRIGEASVASLHPHSFAPGEPWRVRVIRTQDAGVVFYGRKDMREVIHVDIFHEPGFVDHVGAAAALVHGLEALGDELPSAAGNGGGSYCHTRWAILRRRPVPRPVGNASHPLDYVDIQTGTGGGRVTGRLTFGKGPDTRRAHMNHVHLALAWRPYGPLLTLYAVWFLEQEILRQGLELRRIESIIRSCERIDRGALREEFGSDFDSFLSGEGGVKEDTTAGEGPRGAAGKEPGSCALTERESSGRGRCKGTAHQGATGRHCAAPGEDVFHMMSDGGHRGQSLGATPGTGTRAGVRGYGGGVRNPFVPSSDLYDAVDREGDDTYEFITRLGLALDAMEPFLSSRELKETLESLCPGQSCGKSRKDGSTPLEPQAEEALIRKGLVRKEGHRALLTGQGYDLLLFLQRYWPELDCEVRRVLRKLPPGVFRSWGLPAFDTREWVKRRTGRGHAIPVLQGDWPGELAPVETVTRSLERRLMETPSSPSLPTCVGLSLKRADLHEVLYRRRETRDICILLDASSSMAGRRIAAAKRLAAHLLLQGKNRASVIVFKDSSAEVKLPLTRCYRKAGTELSTVQASGLTPLAHGLKKASEYLSGQRCRRPVLVLITDGIPTVGFKNSPTGDAIEAASRLKELGIHLVSIGLEPNRAFLEELSAKASGKLYILGELEGAQLARVIHRECRV